MDYYQNSEDGARRNANGVEIVSVGLALEPQGFDQVVRDFVKNNAFQYSGLDAVPNVLGDRERSRAAYDHFTAMAPEAAQNTRRRLVIVNGLTDSPSHTPWETVVNQDYYRTHANAEAVRTAIDSVKRAPFAPENSSGLHNFAAWAELHEVGEFNDDPDGDGVANGVEFFSGTHPRVANVDPRERVRLIRQTDGNYQLRYPRSARARRVSARLMVSNDLFDWRPHQTSQRAVLPVDALSEDVIVALDGDDVRASYYRLDIAVDLPAGPSETGQ